MCATNRKNTPRMSNLADFTSSPFILSVAGLIGYWFRSVWNYTRFSMLRESGYHLLYNSILFGVVILLVTYAFYVIVFIQLEKYHADRESIFFDPYPIAAYITIVLGIISPYILNHFIFNDKRGCFVRTMEHYGESLYIILLESYEKNQLIELTLNNGQTFIGCLKKPLNFRYENFGYKYADIIPYGSSHQVSIRVEEIVAVRRFGPQDFELVKSSDK